MYREAEAGTAAPVMERGFPVQLLWCYEPRQAHFHSSQHILYLMGE